jgi:hypothetical protein
MTKQTSERGVCNHLWAFVSRYENLSHLKAPSSVSGQAFWMIFCAFPLVDSNLEVANE